MKSVVDKARGTRLPADFLPVPVSGVEAEFAARWRAQAVAGAEEATVAHACALNLVVYVDDVAETANVSAVVDRIAGTHPIRAIGVALDPDAPSDDVRAWVKAGCSAVGSSGRLCSEQIALQGRGTAAARVASAVRSLLTADLPVVLWWRAGRPFGFRIFKELTRSADKIVVDSRRFGDGAAALDTLQRLTDYHGDHVAAVADLNWQRTAAWRWAVAACFEDPDVLRLLPELDRATIRFASAAAGVTAQPSARSLLLAGWLVNRLPRIAGYGDTVGVQSQAAEHGAILELSLNASRSGAAVDIVWEAAAAAGMTAVARDRGGGELRRWDFAPDPQQEAELLHLCVDSLARDELFEAAVRAE